MLNIFLLTEHDNKILVTYPSTELCLNIGDSILFNDKEYLIVHKRFNITDDSMEIFIKKKKFVESCIS